MISDAEKLFSEVFGSPRWAKRLFEITDPDNVITETDGSLTVGTALILPCTLGDMSGGYIYGVCVKPEYRRRGIFRALMKRAENVCRGRGYGFIYLVPQDDALFETYKRLGYTGAVYRRIYGKPGSGQGIKDSPALYKAYISSPEPKFALEEKYFLLWADQADYTLTGGEYEVYREGELYECTNNVPVGKTLLGLYRTLTGDAPDITVNGIYLD